MTLSTHPSMKRLLHYAAAAWLLVASMPGHAEDASKSATDNKSAPANAAASDPSLRKAGFIFMELGTTRVEDYLSFFESVAEFKEMSRKPGYIVAQSALAELTFIDPKFWSGGHPFSGKLTGSGQGLGIEIGIVVADLDKAYAAALKFKDIGWPISTGIVRRPWGARDFRVLAPDGYYLRFTEGH
jgi:lactoylglutathione lyase